MNTRKATEDECIELAQALEQQRALHIVAAVAALPVGGADAEMPTLFHAGYQLACEEIDFRLRTEQWELCGTVSPLHQQSTTATCHKPTNDDMATYNRMRPGQWYYTVGEFVDTVNRLHQAGLIEAGPNPVRRFPAYRRPKTPNASLRGPDAALCGRSPRSDS